MASTAQSLYSLTQFLNVCFYVMRNKCNTVFDFGVTNRSGCRRSFP